MALKISAGDFRTRVNIKAPVKVKNNDGGSEINYPAVTFTTWAAEVKIDQRRVLEAGGSGLLDTRLFYIRYSESKKVIDKDWLFEIGGNNYIIHAKPEILDSGLKVLEIQAKSKHNG